MKRHKWPWSLAAILVLLVCPAIQAGCGGESPTTGYLGHDESSAVFLDWSRTGDSVKGHLSMVLPMNDGLTSLSAPLTGTISGSKVMLRVEAGYAGAPTSLTGTLTDDHLRLHGDDLSSSDLVSATRAQYNAAVVALIPQASEEDMAQQRGAAAESAVKLGIRSLQIGIESYAVEHDNVYPPDADQSTLGEYLAKWPTNPYTGAPMTSGDNPGEYWYTDYGTSFSLDGYGSDGDILISVP